MAGEPSFAEAWQQVYRLCLERALGELKMPVGEAIRWANDEADRLTLGGDLRPENRRRGDV